jgi:Fe-S-cluster-containing hydrogenase component 2
MKTLKITDEKLCTGCQLCVLACSRKIEKGVSVKGSYLRVLPTGATSYKVLIDQGKMTPELAEYCVLYCPKHLLMVSDDDTG